MGYGYRGKILHVDLNNRQIEVEEKDDTFYRTYLGGRGIGYHYLLRERFHHELTPSLLRIF